MKRLVTLIIVFLIILPMVRVLTAPISPTSEPWMKVGCPDCATLAYGPYPPTAVGQTFPSNVCVKSIDPAWDLCNASFTLAWNNAVIDVLGPLGANVTVDLSWAIITNDWSVPGQWTFAANYSGTVPPLPNSVLVATLTFTVLLQESIPPYPPGWCDASYLALSNIVLWSHTLEIPQAQPEQAMVFIYALLTPSHDIAVTNLNSAQSIVFQGDTENVTVTVENHGGSPETFNVTVYANMTDTSSATIIATFLDTTLDVGKNTTLTALWVTTGFAEGNYTISAYADPVPGETDTADNTFVGSTVQIVPLCSNGGGGGGGRMHYMT